MLSRLDLKGFKSFKEASFELSGLTVLVGANASGKSNALDAIRFLQGLALGYSLAESLGGRREAGNQVWPGVRGGVADVVWKGAVGFRIESNWRLAGELELGWGLEVQVDGSLRLRAESLNSIFSDKKIFESNDSTALQPAGPPNRRGAFGMVNPSEVQSDSTSAQFRSRRAMAERDLLQSALRGALFLDIQPSQLRDYAPIAADGLGLQGENISALTWQICQDADARQDLVDWLAELCAPELVDLDFATTELGDVMLVFVEAGGRRIPARSLSDGTLRFLGELIALRTAPEGALLLVEEIENGLHPTRVHLLVEAMASAVETRGVQVIATTHSPMVLSALAPQSLRDAVLVACPPDSEGSIARRLGDLPDFDAVCARRGVDHLFSTGWLERAL